MIFAAAIEVSGTMAAGAGVAGLATFAAHSLLLRKWIRTEAGVKETTKTEVADQPLRVTQEKEYLERAAMTLIETMIQSVREDHIAGDGRLEKRIDEMAQQIEANRQQTAEENSRRASSVHKRMDQMAQQIADLPIKIVAHIRDAKAL